MHQKEHNFTHKALAELAVRWLKRVRSSGGPGCAIAMSECKTGYSGEIPDAIGFRRTGHAQTDGSVVIEVKISRADFLADAKKPHRVSGGVGSWRYYMAPTGLIAPMELPTGWGLLEVNPRGHVKAVAGHAVHFKSRHDEFLRQADLWRFAEVDMQREQFLLVRIIANTGDPQKVLDMLREANNQRVKLLTRIAQIADALGLPDHTSSYEVERHARTMVVRYERLKERFDQQAPLPGA